MYKLVAAIFSGGLISLSSAPYDLWYLAYFGFVPLFYVAQNSSPLKQGLLFSLSCTLIATTWWHSSIIFSLSVFLSIVAVLSVAFFSWAILSSSFRHSQANPFFSLFMPAVIWVGIERILSSEWLGIPCNIGVTQATQPILIQSASFFGVYTISFLIIVANSFFVLLLRRVRENNLTRLDVSAISLAFFIFIGNIVYGYYTLTKPTQLLKPINVSMVQPVISSKLYNNGWRNPSSRKFIRETLSQLTLDALNTKPDLLIWPEGGNGYFNMRIKGLRDKLYTLATQYNTDLLISSNDLDSEGRKYNSIFSISKQGRLLGQYNKVMLIPSAEASFSAGTGFHTLATSYGKVGPAICYESNFPSILRKTTSQGAGLLVVSTSDAAFKKTSLTINHTRTAIFRAVENNRWLIQASNTGRSIIVSPLGVIQSSGGFYQREIVSGQVEHLTEKSVFTRYGYLVPIFCAVLVMLLFLNLLIISGKLYLSSKNSSSLNIFKNVNEVKNKLFPPLFYRRYVPMFVIYILFLVVTIVISISLVGQQVTGKTAIAKSVQDFITPLNEQEPDQISSVFLQAQKNTCGPAVLAYLFSFYGLDVTEVELVPQLKMMVNGTSMLELKMLAIKLGFKAIGVKENYRALMDEPLPVIAYISNSHYVVVNKITKQHVYVFDPSLGHVKLLRSTFEEVWNGYLLLIRMNEINKSISTL